MSIDKVKERIKSLLAKASDQGATNDERQSAMEMARKLLNKHGLSEDEIKNATTDDFSERDMDGLDANIIKPVDKYLAVTIAKLAGVRVIASYDAERNVAVTKWIGFTADVEFALWLRQSVIDKLEADWKVFKRVHVGRVTREKYSAMRVSFVRGFLKAAHEIMIGQINFLSKKSADDRALVIVKEKAAEEEMHRRGYNPSGTYRNATSRASNAKAAAAGRVAGQQVNTSGGGVSSGRIAIGNG